MNEINKLIVFRHFSDARKVEVGQLAQNSTGIYFQYNDDYLANEHNLSPFKLNFDNRLAKAPKSPHSGLQGVFSDSLPDGWGRLLMDRVFKHQGIQPHQVTPLHRLAYIGDNAIGALSYQPTIQSYNDSDSFINIHDIGKNAIKLFEGNSDVVLPAIAQAGSAAGARPKALIYINNDNDQQITTYPKNNYSPWIIKFTSATLPLGHQEGLCEAAYLTMAKLAGINVPQWRLIESNIGNKPVFWLAIKRFDCIETNNSKMPEYGRKHLITLSGLLDADYRQPSLDYEDIIKACQMLSKDATTAQQQFIRAMFNLFAINQDDHCKNSALMVDDSGNWTLSPAYDITYSPNAFNQHTTAFSGFGNQPNLKAIQKLAFHANYNWHEAIEKIQAIRDALSQWSVIAAQLNISPAVIKSIDKHLSSLVLTDYH